MISESTPPQIAMFKAPIVIGLPLKYIQSQVGHSNFLTTMNAYSKLIKDVNEHAVDVLEKTVSIL